MCIILIKIMFVCLFTSAGLAILQDQLRPEKEIKQIEQQIEQQDTLSSLKQ